MSTKTDMPGTVARKLADALRRWSDESQVTRAYHDVFMQSPDPAAILSPDGIVLQLNRAAASLSPTGPSESIGHYIWDAPRLPQHAESRAAMRAAIAAAGDGTLVRYDLDLDIGGERKPFEVTLTPLHAPDGSIALLTAVARDVSARKRVERALEASERRLSGIVSIAADAIITVDDAQRITLFNRGAETIFGYAAAEVLGQPLGILLPEDSRDTHAREVRQFANSGATARRMGERRAIFGRRKSGEIFPAEASISRVLVEGQQLLTAVLRDVTQRWIAEQDRAQLLAEAESARDAAEQARRDLGVILEAGDVLAESLDLETTLHTTARLLVDGIPQICLVDLVDEDGTIRRVHALHGDPAQQSLADALKSYPRRQDAPLVTRSAIETGRTQLRTYRSDADLRADANSAAHLELLREYQLRYALCAPLATGGRVLGAIALLRSAGTPPFTDDELALLTEVTRRAALAIEHARLYEKTREAVAYRERILGIVSHDLRNPLSAIAMCTAALRRPDELPPEERARLVDTIQESVVWMQRLIGDLLDMASIRSGRLSLNPVVADPVMLVARAAHLFEGIAEERNVSLRVDAEDRLPGVVADEQRILQVLGNLLGNSVKFTPAGGRVTLRARPVEAGVCFEVQDTGPGIDQGDLEHIFDLFWHARRGRGSGGAGLGLAIARGIVNAHGGELSVDTEAGQGSTFRFTLPFGNPDAGRDRSARE